uniref:T-box domain-containing protein n=1 Tax=Anopheles culicifacies TaxID=139723 RepID=A0A182MQH7_9DIPT
MCDNSWWGAGSGSQNSSVDRLSEADDEVDVDVEECSDSEEPKSSEDSGRVTHSRTTETPNSISVSDEERLSPEPAQKRPTIVGSCNSDDLRPVQCHLETKELWDKFNELGTEMIITKTGRLAAFWPYVMRPAEELGTAPHGVRYTTITMMG